MNTALWIITGLLTAVYLFSGIGKLFVPREKMAAMARQVEADGASPWTKPETLAPWQEGTAAGGHAESADG